MPVQRVSDLTVDDLKQIIREVVRDTLREWLRDPDEGLELDVEARARLERSLAEHWSEENTSSAEEVARRLGLEW